MIRIRWHVNSLRAAGDVQGWHTLGAQGLSHRYDKDPIAQVPPFISYQMAAIFTERILEPLRHKTLKQLQDVILANMTSNWFIIHPAAQLRAAVPVPKGFCKAVWILGKDIVVGYKRCADS